MQEKYSTRLQAVTGAKDLLPVIAGASSGKTGMLTNRPASLVEDDASAASILLPTYTCKAARQLLLRIAELLLLNRRCKKSDT
jgi:superfamily I DNA/RNA helicase